MIKNKEIFKKNIVRENVINYIYSHEVMNTKINSKNAFELGNYTENEINIIEKITKNYDTFKKIIILFTKKSWNWKRISPLNRSLLLYGAFEMSFTNKAIVIDVLIKLTKKYSPDESYKFINSILDKVGKYYEKIKNNKK